MADSSIQLNQGVGGSVLATDARGGKEYQQVDVAFADSHNLDAFGRIRVSSAKTLFDSKQIFDNLPLFWDDQEVSGTGTTSTHSVNRASSTLATSNLTVGSRVRQTFRRFNYESGKSHLIEMTGVIGAAVTGTTKRIGYFDENNGIFFEQTAAGLNVGLRSFATGAAVDTTIPQSSWNIDRLDGLGGTTNPSGVTFDVTKSQIFVMDMQWLAVGRVRYGIDIGGSVVYVHEMNHANTLDVVYMSTPNLPCRVEITNDGTGPISQIEQICATVISEAGAGLTGLTTYHSTDGVHIDANTSDTVYAVLGYELKSNCFGASATPEHVSAIAETADGFEWILLFNPTVAGTFTYSDEINSCLRQAVGVTTNTVTGGFAVDGGWVSASGGTIDVDINSVLALGASIASVSDQLVFCVRPTGANADINAGITFLEKV